MEVCIHAAITISSFLGIVSMNQKINRLEEQLKTLKNTPIFTPQSLIEDIGKGTQLIKQFFTQDGDDLKGQIFLEGILTSPKSIKSVIDKSKSILVSQFFASNIYSNEDKDLKKPPSEKDLPSKSSQITKNCAPFFYLKDYESSAQCKVQKNLDVKFINILSLISLKRYMTNLSILEKMLILIFQIMDVLKFMKIKGIKVGYQEVELGVVLNETLTILGEVIFNKVTKTLNIKEPQYFLKDKKYLIQSMKDKIKNRKILTGILYIPFIISLVQFIKKLKPMISNYFQKIKLIKKDKLNNISKLQVEDLKCIICMNNTRNVIFKPCKHFCLCRDCAKLLNKQECPMCKKNIDDTIEIFIA